MIGPLPQAICSASMPKAIQVCCVSSAFLIVDLTFHGIVLLKFDANHHAGIVLLLLETTYLSNRTGAFLKSYKQGARLALPSCACSVAPLLLKSLHPRRLRNTCNPADALSSSAMNRVGQRRKVFAADDAA